MSSLYRIILSSMSCRISPKDDKCACSKGQGTFPSFIATGIYSGVWLVATGIVSVNFVRTLNLEAVSEAPVLPILLHCAEELSQRKDLQYGQIVITTPCRALVEQGNKLGLDRTTFVTAKEFLADIGYNSATPITRSPIPPGFYDPLSVSVVSATGEKEIAKEAVNLSKGIRLFEMLFCFGGCHNGDGI